MHLVLFRHGIAELSRPDLPDADRCLTPEGIQRTAKAAEGLLHVIDSPDLVLTSPKRRARQTAMLLSDVCDRSPTVFHPLADAPAEAIAEALSEVQVEGTLVLVGHEPTLSALAEWLAFGRITGRLSLKKAGAIGLDLPEEQIDRFEPGLSTLTWLLPPRQLRELCPTL